MPAHPDNPNPAIGEILAMSPADRTLVGPLAWTPQQKAQYDVAFFRGLARDRQAQRVYLAKVRIVETVRAKAPAQLCGGCKDNNLCKGAGRAGARSLGRNGPPTGAAAENRKRRKKSEAQRQKGAQKLQHRWLQRRCEAAAAKPGGSPPKILARVLACCGRFFELLLPEGAERMQRLRDEQQAQSLAMEVDAGEAGLNAMRRALAAVEDKEVPPRAARPEAMDIGAPKGAVVQSKDRGGQAAVAKPSAKTTLGRDWTPGVARPRAGRRRR